MREWVGYGGVGGAEFGPEFGGAGVRAGRRPRRSVGWRPDGRRPAGRGAGPRPVRPVAAPTAVRPEEPPRPEGPGGRPVVVDERGPRPGERVLARRPVAGPVRCGGHTLRRVVAGAGVAVATAVAVVALGLLGQLAQAGIGQAGTGQAGIGQAGIGQAGIGQAGSWGASTTASA